MDAVEDVKGRLSIEDVISRYVELKRAGRNFRGLSPFNNEKSPSFMVSPEKQIWHDFSSGKGGNMFSFVMEMEGIDFRGALELLARQAGIDLSQYQKSGGGQRTQQKQRLSEALELAAKFYQAHFKKNRPSLDYIIKKRKFTKETALKFRIGYAPNSGDASTRFLLNKGFTLNELKQAGLTTQRYQQPGDMFRDRLMIPLMDPFGSVIGFTARTLVDEANAPKYINTPQTILYDKSRHVFGMHLAKEAIRKNGYVVVVEGNMDVIASHQVGVSQTVATAGTAITEQHLKMVGRLTHDVRLAFDQDLAGLAAAERAIPLASKQDISLSILTLTSAKDPDELIQKDPTAWQKAIDNPQYALDWLIERYQDQLDLTGAQGKRQFTDILFKVIRQLDDSVEQDHYINRLSKLIGINPEALRTKLTKGAAAKPTLKRRTSTPAQDDASQRELIKAQNHFLAIMLMQPGLRMYLKLLTDDILPQPAAKKLLTYLKKYPKFVFEETAEVPPETREYCQILVLLYEELYQEVELLDMRYEAAQLRARLLQQYVKFRKTALAKLMRDNGDSNELLTQAKELDMLLNSTKGDN